ncbi:nuclear protein 1, isoform CRA_c [Rattus norvegicus]|uniref:Nuclear protein 1, isoform CRA_c n=1 Tax=Rattus norvegicus TaxID=10116 RepID=A6I998_RAT|nr:nuclear protein 1, isoform CRA_c [Rattus norvegicus]
MGVFLLCSLGGCDQLSSIVALPNVCRCFEVPVSMVSSGEIAVSLQYCPRDKLASPFPILEHNEVLLCRAAF